MFSAKNIEDAYEYIGRENILSVFPDCELELFDLDYSDTFSDEKYSQQWYLDTIDFEYANNINVTGKDVKMFLCIIEKCMKKTPKIMFHF